VGCGKLGEAILNALLLRGGRSLEVVVTAKTSERRRLLAEKYGGVGVEVAESNADAVKEADVVIVTVKPHQVVDVAREVSGLLDGKVLASFAAGVSASVLEKLFSGARVVRAMTSIAVAYGAPVLVSSSDREAADCVCSLFTHAAPCYVVGEELIDAFTALVGSGPALIAYLVETYADAAVLMGVPRDLALATALKVFASTAKLMEEKVLSPRAIIDLVATPGGTTVEALYTLDKRRVRASLMEALARAALKAKRISTTVSEAVKELTTR